ncbi:MAG: hypothetical protein EHM21_00815 [Chloroflexi bacterium]|nr:MAG: hypothetical protein EHM21_00815 [Chloroflexota bacterium]
MFRKTCLPILILALSLAACQPGFQLSGASAAEKPLPLTGASASRLGAAALTLQMKHGTENFSLVPVSADTGQPLADAAPVVLGSSIFYGFSTDRGEMAVLSSQYPDCQTGCLRLIDLRSWKEVLKPFPLNKRFDAWAVIPEFDSASGRLAVIRNDSHESASLVELVDRVQSGVVRQQSLPANILKAAYTPAGALAVWGIQASQSGKESKAYVALLDGADLHLLWEMGLAEISFGSGWTDTAHSDPTQAQYLEPAAAFSADGSKLYVAAADRPLLVTVDLQKQSVTTARIQPRTGLLDRLMALGARPVQAKFMNGVSKVGALSQDGRYFYVAGQETKAVKNERGEYDMEFHPLGLQVIDTRDGALVRTIATETSRAELSPDGKALLLNGWRFTQSSSQSWAEVLDTASWEVKQEFEGSVFSTRLLDGSLAWLVIEQNDVNASKLSIYRPGESTPRSQVTKTTYVDWISIP